MSACPRVTRNGARGARGGRLAAEGAGSPNALTQRALGRETWALGAGIGAGWTPERPRPPPPPPPFFSPRLASPRRRHGRSAARKKIWGGGAGSRVGRWVRVRAATQRALGGRWVVP